MIGVASITAPADTVVVGASVVVVAASVVVVVAAAAVVVVAASVVVVLAVVVVSSELDEHAAATNPIITATMSTWCLTSFLPHFAGART